jgi:alpha-1,3/alpha-1,6-mannosyltransferase
VLAVNSGGPVETIVDLGPSLSNRDGTGLLCEPSEEKWSEAISLLVNIDEKSRERIAKAARKRVKEKFSSETLGVELEDACREAFKLGDVHTQLGDRLIWGGASLAGIAGIALVVTIMKWT